MERSETSGHDREWRFDVTVQYEWPICGSHHDLARIEEVPLAARALPESTYAVVAAAEARWPERIAMHLLGSGTQWDKADSWTYARLAQAVRGCANLFHAQGVSRTSAVTLMSANTGLVLAATFGAQAAGIAAPVNPSLAAERLVALARLADSRVIVAAGPELDPDTWAKARHVASSVGIKALYAVRPEGALGSGPDLQPLTGTTVDYLDTALAGQPEDALECSEPAADDIASYFHTGGTTGTPKLAAHTHHNEVAMAWSLALLSTLPESSTVLAGLPLFHVNAVLVTGLSPLLRGYPVVWIGPAGFRDLTVYQHFWKIVERYQVAAMSAVPTVYAVLAEIPLNADISSMLIAAVGAAPLPEAVRASFRARTGIELSEGYGLTEGTCVSAASQFEIARRGSVGLRLPYQHIVAVERDGQGNWIELPAGRSGQLKIYGPNVFPGYVSDGGELTGGDALHEGGLLTGDLGYVDPDGYVFLIGRAKDVIIRGGHNIDPTVIEDALREHPAVADVAAVGRPDTYAGEVPVAYVVANEPVSEAELLRWAQQAITEPAAVVKAVYIVDAIPLTQIGKPFKPALRADAARCAVAENLAEAGCDSGHLDIESDYSDDGQLVVRVKGVNTDDLVAARKSLNLLPLTIHLPD
ncbi:acyl-CoA synthetase [Mycobacterium sp. 134]|uniref:acyl-CoA synthetase n=1 Tax=Mycobacterium sp. 134 TaxID=3400425 RepID=UPI003AAA59C2